MSGLGWIGPAITATDNIFQRGHSIISAKEANKNQLQMMDKAQDFTREGWKRDDWKTERHMNDLRRSGINPIMAMGGVSSASGSAGSVSGSAHQANTPSINDAGSGVTSAFMAEAQKKRLKTQGQLDLASAMSATARAIADLQNVRIKKPAERIAGKTSEGLGVAGKFSRSVGNVMGDAISAMSEMSNYYGRKLVDFSKDKKVTK